MTNIKLHGILAKEFGKEINLNIDSLATIIDAIDCNKNGFIKKLNKLSEMGLNYCLIADGKIIKEKHQLKDNIPTEIDFVPIVCGQGVVAAIVGVGFLVAGSALSITALSVIGGIFLSTGLSMLLAPTPEYPDIPAAESSVTGLEKSFAFANRANIAAQGVSVPIGYGRLRVGSQVVQGSIKTFPQNVLPLSAMESNAYQNDNTKSKSASEVSAPQ